MIKVGRAFGSGGQRMATGAAALLAVFGISGVSPAAAQVSSSAGPTWTEQAPAAHPRDLAAAAMAYDAATGNVVLFGGAKSGHDFNDTWIWG